MCHFCIKELLNVATSLGDQVRVDFIVLAKAIKSTTNYSILQESNVLNTFDTVTKLVFSLLGARSV